MRKNARVGLVVAVVLVLLAVLVARHAVARFAITSILSLATGYRVEIGDVRLGSDHGAFLDTHVSRHGEPVLDAARVDVYYHLRDLLPGSSRRFGLVGVTIDQPQVTLIHHQDGTYNVKTVGGGGGPAGPSGPVVPLNFFARVRGGQAQLIDDYQYYKEARLQRVHNIDADINVNTQTRTHYTVRGAFVDVKDQPFRAAGTVDYTKGYAMHRVDAAAIPIKTIGNYVINSPAAHILAGTARDFHATIYGLGFGPNDPIPYHVNAVTQMNDGQLYIRGLAKPLDGIRGTLQIFDGGLSARRLDASIGGIPVNVAGGIFDFRNPQFRLGVAGAGPLEQLRSVLDFAKTQPVSGNVRVRTMIEGPISQPAIFVGIDGDRAYYGKIPLDHPNGTIGLYGGVVAIAPLRASYGGIALSVHGRLKLGKTVDSNVTVSYDAPSNRVPYLGALVSSDRISGTALLSGQGTQLTARGYLATVSPAVASSFYSIASNGTGTIGPFFITPLAGGSAVGEYSLDRPHGESAFWVSAQDLRIRQPQPVAFAGLALAQLPQIDGHIVDADVIGNGSGDHVAIAGRALAEDSTIASVRFNNIGVSFAGSLNNAAINSAHADGPWGRFDGNGSVAPGALIARGAYSGTLDALRPFTGDIKAHGALSGPMAIALVNNRVIVQAQNAQLRGATVSGVPLSNVSGTIAYENGKLRVYQARAGAAGGDLVAAGMFAKTGSVAVATTTLDGRQLRGLGIPIQGGHVAAVGTLAQGAPLPTFDGGVVVRNATSNGIPLEGSANMHLAGNGVVLSDAVGDVNGTVGIANGRIDALTSGAPAYNVLAYVPAGDVVRAATTLHLPTFQTVGSFFADVHVGGAGLLPTVDGHFDIPVGSVNGMNFEDAHSQIVANHNGVHATNGHVLVGTTQAQFSTTMTTTEHAVHIHSSKATLSDFNDYFDTGDTLAGHGLIDLAFVQNGRSVSSSGDVDVLGFRYRQLPIGDTEASWFSTHGVASGVVKIGGEHGVLNAHGTVAFMPSSALDRIVAGSTYNVNASLTNLDLSTWLPAFGFPTVPLTGRVDGTARVSGRYPHLAVGGDASIRNGTIGPLPIELAQASARAVDSRIQITNARMELPALSLDGSGSLGLAPHDPLKLQVHGRTDNPSRLIALVSKRSVDVNGSFESTVNIGGTFARPTYSAGVYATNVRAYGVGISSLIGGLTLAGRDLRVSNLEVNFLTGRVTIAGTLPLQLQPFAIGPPNAPVNLDATAERLDLAAFAPLLGTGSRVGGTVDGRIAFAGRIDAPQVFGRIALSNGLYASQLETVPVSNIAAQLTFNGTRATIDRLHANPGRGSLDGNGTMTFQGNVGAGALAYNARATARGAQLNFPAYGSGTLDADVTLTRAPRQLALLKGSVTATDAAIPFAAFMRGTDTGTAPAGGPGGLNLAFDMGITAGKNVRVRGGGIGAGLDISGTGHVALTGTLQKPQLDGRFDSAGGTLTYVDHAFRVQSGFVQFRPQNGIIPDVHAVGLARVVNPDPNTARNTTGTADITIKVDGPVNAPTIAFSSDPPGYSKDQIIALLLPFGGLVGPIQFTDTGVILPPGQLRGAPVASTGAPLPNIFVQREGGQLTLSQEAFNILNAQFTQGLLSPLESVLGNSLGFSDVNLTIDYTGTFGVNFRRSLARNFYAVYATTIGVPIRQTFGLQYQPTQYTVAQFSYFEQQGPVQVFLSPSNTVSTNPRATAGQAVTGNNGFTFTIQRLF